MRKLTQEEFIQKAKLLHGKRYDYSKTNYTNSSTKVEILCVKHGNFLQKAEYHLRNEKPAGCPQCALVNNALNRTLNQNDVIEKARKTRGNQYDYSRVKYKGTHVKIEIICRKHGVFLQTPNRHIDTENGCPKCGIIKAHKNSIKTLNQFFNDTERVHGNKYDYSKVEYKGVNIKVKIICSKHGLFKQTPNEHINHKTGCPNCSRSKGEEQIIKILKDLNINYLQQYKFSLCKDKQPLRFDFYLPNYNLCIEHDGQQHFKAIKQFGGQKAFENTLRRDQIKNNFCEANNIKLLRIPYTKFDDIEQLVKEVIV